MARFCPICLKQNDLLKTWKWRLLGDNVSPLQDGVIFSRMWNIFRISNQYMALFLPYPWLLGLGIKGWEWEQILSLLLLSIHYKICAPLPCNIGLCWTRGVSSYSCWNVPPGGVAVVTKHWKLSLPPGHSGFLILVYQQEEKRVTVQIREHILTIKWKLDWNKEVRCSIAGMQVILWDIPPISHVLW